jgi:hypothetical protein
MASGSAASRARRTLATFAHKARGRAPVQYDVTLIPFLCGERQLAFRVSRRQASCSSRRLLMSDGGHFGVQTCT